MTQQALTGDLDEMEAAADDLATTDPEAAAGLAPLRRALAECRAGRELRAALRAYRAAVFDDGGDVVAAGAELDRKAAAYDQVAGT